MTHTRYSPANIFLLVAGALVALFCTFLASLTAGFAAEFVPRFSGYMTVCFFYTALVCGLAYLVMLRWCSVGSTALWIIVILCFAFGLLSGNFLHYGGIIILLLLEALICQAICSGSKKESKDA